MEVVEDTGLGQVFYELNVADPAKGLQDFRIPDLLVILRNSASRMRETYVAGGPDFILEVHSPDDETYEKIPWYAAQGVRELLVVDRDTKALRLFRASGGELREVAASAGVVECETVPLRFERVEEGGKVRVRVMQRASPGRVWHV
jgi:Uma2 family endonuclease